MDTVRAWVDELEREARARLTPAVYEYVRTGSFAETSVAEAVRAWDDVRLRPRSLAAVNEVDTSVDVLGGRCALPVGVAPTSLQRAAHPDGEVAMAEGVRDAGSLMVVPSNCSAPFADIAATGVRWWLQLYVTQERERCLPVLASAVAHGAEAVVLTVDAPVVATKPAGAARVWDEVPASWVRTNFPTAADADAPKAHDLGPDDVSLLAERGGVPVVVKGVLRGDDVPRCVDAGATAVWVSNHGGRQLDRTVTTRDGLVEVSRAGERAGCEVYVDGGIRDAGHVLAALALGARCVFVGRPAFYALTCGGASGVRQLGQGLRRELEEQLLLSGAAAPQGLPDGLVI